MFSADLGVTPSGKTYIEDVFSTYLYTGNGSTQTITNGIDLAGKGGLVWLKDRGTTSFLNTNYGHGLVDTVRGSASLLSSNTTSATVNSGTNLISSFNSDGFSLGGWANAGSAPFASWTFRKAPKFFDVVTYTGTGSNRTISHSLGSVPGCIIVKRTDTTGNWQVYHNSLTSAAYGIQLNLTNAQASDTTLWNSTAATASVFSLGTSTDVNASGGSYVAYLFAHDTTSDGLIQCGSFTTDGSGNASVTLGWEPQWVLLKNTNTGTEDWYVFDSMRGWTVPNTANDAWLRPNLSNAEGTSTTSDQGGPTATGFSVANRVASGTYIYIAIRRGPMRTPTSGTSVFKPVARAGTGTTTAITGVGFPPDMALIKQRSDSTNGGNQGVLEDRLRGAPMALFPDQTTAETSSPAFITSINQDGVTVAAGNSTNGSAQGNTYANWFFRRAPGFFDQVCYTGDGFGTGIKHNLGVVPELIIQKSRSSPQFWNVYVSPALTGGVNTLVLNTTAAATTTSNVSNVTAIQYDTGFASSGVTYVNYLFASCPGVSKVGSYTGNGTSQTINCGFAAGARFVLIKSTDSTGDWYVWDSARGIVSGNDPHLSLNTTAAEVTTDDTIDPDSSGFIVNQLAATNVNVNAATYIYLAIA